VIGSIAAVTELRVARRIVGGGAGHRPVESPTIDASRVRKRAPRVPFVIAAPGSAADNSARD
jgi:hypothetical protein